MRSLNTISVFLILVFLGTLTFAEDLRIPEQEKLILKLQHRLRINRQDAEAVMKQLRKEIKKKKQNKFCLNNAAVDNILRICKRFGIQVGEIARVMAAGNYYSDVMKKNGSSKKQITRNMYMLMYKEMKKSGNIKNIAERIMKRMMANIRIHNGTALKSGNGSKMHHRYKKQYQNERSDRGSHGTAAGTTAGIPDVGNKD
ncbi:MAG: hypothetical protein KAS64_01095 [Spirochaetes bacterium]|nr:hypothetical protein [Spirochaetota bacterium]